MPRTGRRGRRRKVRRAATDGLPPLEVTIFYSRTCPRCKALHPFIHQAEKHYGNKVRFFWMDTHKYTVQRIIDRKYPCVSRIPAMVVYDDIYWVGTPSKDDFYGVMNYLIENPEGGKGVRG